MAENEEKKSRRALLNERLAAKYPDLNIGDDEAVSERIGADYDDMESQLNGYRDREAKLTELFSNNPRAALFISDMAKGADPMTAWIERLGRENIMELLDDPEKREAYAEANRKYMERVAEEKRLEEEYEKNLAESLANLQQFQLERGLSDEQIDAAYDLVTKIGIDALNGKVSVESVDMALKALHHDTDVESAREEGEVAGRNQKIVEQRRRAKSDDGVRALTGANNVAAEQFPKRKSIIQMAREEEMNQ